MTKPLDLTGNKYGRYTVIERTSNSKFGKTRWVCLCECGNQGIVVGSDLKTGKAKSCGCIQLIHGHSSHRTYNIFTAMKERCYNPKSTSYNWYGGKGIQICDEWLDDFDKFYNWSINNGYKSNFSIDRIDNSNDYCPENCRWIDKKQQQKNQGLRKDNSSGVKGVKFHKSTGKWEVGISVDGKRHYLGVYEDFEEAKKVRMKAEKEFWDI